VSAREATSRAPRTSSSAPCGTARSTLTTTFRSARERHTALGVWGAVSGLGGAAGVLFGAILTEAAGWRWVLFVNVPSSAIALAGAFALL
jgi:MFS family permease